MWFCKSLHCQFIFKIFKGNDFEMKFCFQNLRLLGIISREISAWFIGEGLYKDKS